MKYIILKRGPVHVSLKNRDNQVYVYFTGLFFNFRLKIGKNIYVLHSGCKSEIILITNYLLIFVLTSNSGYFSLSLLSYLMARMVVPYFSSRVSPFLFLRPTETLTQRLGQHSVLYVLSLLANVP